MPPWVMSEAVRSTGFCAVAKLGMMPAKASMTVGRVRPAATPARAARIGAEHADGAAVAHDDQVLGRPGRRGEVELDGVDQPLHVVGTPDAMALEKASTTTSSLTMAPVCEAAGLGAVRAATRLERDHRGTARRGEPSDFREHGRVAPGTRCTSRTTRGDVGVRRRASASSHTDASASLPVADQIAHAEAALAQQHVRHHAGRAALAHDGHRAVLRVRLP